MKTIFDFDFEALSIFKVLGKFGPGIIQKTITGLFPLTWQDGIGGSLVDYSLNGRTAYSGSKNQLVQNGNFQNTDGWYQANASLSAVNNKLVITSNVENDDYLVGCLRGESAIVLSGEKYYLRIGNVEKPNGKTTFLLKYKQSDNELTEISGSEIDYIETAQNNYYAFGVFFARPSAIGEVSKISNFQVFNLTKMFGAGNEPSTVSEAKSLIARVMNHGTPLDYYPYDSGTPYEIGVGDYGGKRNQLLNYNSFAPSKVESGISFTNNGDGSITVNGTSTDQCIYELHRIDTVANHKYLVVGAKNELSIQFNNYFTEDGIYTENLNDYWTAKIYVSQGVTINNATVKLNIIDLTEMFPNETITDVTTAKQRIAEVMGESDYYPYDAGTDYYGIPEVVTSGACIDLGSLTWNKDTTIRPADGATIHACYANISGCKKVSSLDIGNLYIKGFTAERHDVVDYGGYDEVMDNIVGGADNNGKIWLYSSALNDLTGEEVKSALNGVLLYYQRATDDSWYIQNKTAYRNAQLTAGQSISMLQDNLPHFDNLPTGYLQMGVDTAVAPSGGSVTYKSRSVSI